MELDVFWVFTKFLKFTSFFLSVTLCFRGKDVFKIIIKGRIRPFFWAAPSLKVLWSGQYPPLGLRPLARAGWDSPDLLVAGHMESYQFLSNSSSLVQVKTCFRLQARWGSGEQPFMAAPFQILHVAWCVELFLMYECSGVLSSIGPGPRVFHGSAFLSPVHCRMSVVVSNESILGPSTLRFQLLWSPVTCRICGIVYDKAWSGFWPHWDLDLILGNELPL